MMTSTTAPSRSTQRKRNRKRKRRNASESSSSSSSSQSSDSDSKNDAGPSTRKPVPAKIPSPTKPDTSDSDDSDESESDSDKDAETLSDSDGAGPEDTSKQDLKSRQDSPPPPHSVPLPAFLDSSKGRDETALKEAFRKRWMSSMADAFAGDLEQIRKEPNLTQSRLGLLIDSLASGADVYTRTKDDGTMDVDNARIVLDGEH